MKEEQEHAKTMLSNEKEFNRVFEETFDEYQRITIEKYLQALLYSIL